MRPLLIVGEAPGRGGAGEPLAGRSGRRLADLAGVLMETFLLGTERINVMPEWPGKAGKGDRFALLAAIPHARSRVLPTAVGRHVVLLGRAGAAVERALLEAACLDARDLAFTHFSWHHVLSVRSTFACCPHPSGISRWWNISGNVEAARAFWAGLAFNIRMNAAVALMLRDQGATVGELRRSLSRDPTELDLVNLATSGHVKLSTYANRAGDFVYFATMDRE